ncbi:MAG: hypothetical protein M1837_004893 [Sclerophora amabilis]|nr:MAG: hypothetical protein M1837_004893 [Sclerophora amabilis]
MEDFMEFDSVFSFRPEHTYDHKTIETILDNRRNLENELFFDRLLKVFQINQAAHLYPPKSNHDLRVLHHGIVSSNFAEHHRQSLLYYLLLDCRASRNAAEEYAQRTFLPEKYVTYMRGLWHMDRMQFQTALEWLTQPSLIPTFPEPILITLVRHAPPNDLSLALAYYHTVAPTISTSKSLEVLYSALCRTSTTEAFYFARAQSGQTRRHLLEQLIHAVLSSSRGEEGASKAVELINQPFTGEEEQWFEQYLTVGKGRNLSGAKDTVIMRRIGRGKFSELDDIKGPSGRKVDGVNWDTLKKGLMHGLSTT